ncbi:hypothetical protein Ac2012v2_003671 [Leucoagaricus gongylophorus]
MSGLLLPFAASLSDLPVAASGAGADAGETSSSSVDTSQESFTSGIASFSSSSLEASPEFLTPTWADPFSSSELSTKYREVGSSVRDLDSGVRDVSFCPTGFFFRLPYTTFLGAPLLEVSCKPSIWTPEAKRACFRSSAFLCSSFCFLVRRRPSFLASSRLT